MHESPVNAADRRQKARIKLAEIAYIGMGPENGGLVLDVSDGGLSFHAVAPIQPAEKVRFTLSLRGHSRIEGAGEVVWTNQRGTVCGLKFTSLSAGALEHLNNWTNQSQMAQKAVVPARAKTVAPAPKAAPALPDAGRSLLNTAPVFAIPPAAAVNAEPNASESTAEMRWQSPLFIWATFGILAAAFVVIAYLYGVHVGKSEFKSAPLSATAPGSQTIPAIDGGTSVPAAPDAGNAPPTSGNTPTGPSAAAPVPGVALVVPPKTESHPAIAAISPSTKGNTASVQVPRAVQKSDGGKTELAAALAQLNGDNGRRDTSAAVRLLWVAVAKGNVTAEVTLADLYVYGDGVEQNCDQGRALLKTASESGNTQAKVKLDELNANGCP